MTSFYPASSLDLGQPVGRIVDVDGRAVHVVDMGVGAPTVWLENGWLATCLGWQPFQNMLAAHTRVCAYDRAGVGFSDPVDSGRCAQNEADEFADLLDAMGETAPIILLAWSGGGPVAQVFAADHPERVAGLILMDAIPPTYDLWATRTYPERYPRERDAQLEQVRAFAEGAAAGTLREDDIADWLTPEVRAVYGDRYTRQLLRNPNFWWTYNSQYQSAIASGAQVNAKGSLGDLPLTILIADDFEMGAEPYHHQLGRMWRELQVAQAQLSSRSRVIRAPSGHAIFREQPQAVIDAVLDMIAAHADDIHRVPDAEPERVSR
ncbi:MAG: alpha/beta hydrolase [Chloroflexota bacterium]|nr:alpha/beta hydrolase [Chloroflexota bacterium]